MKAQFRIGEKVLYKTRSWRDRTVRCRTCRGTGVLIRSDKTKIACTVCNGSCRNSIGGYKTEWAEDKVIAIIRIAQLKGCNFIPVQYRIDGFAHWINPEDLRKMSQPKKAKKK